MRDGLSFIASSAWMYPALEVVHLVGVAMLLGSLVVLELRVWGAGRTLELAALARLALPVSLCGFGLVVLAGLGLFAAHPAEMLANRAFLIKMGLVCAAGLNAAAFHARGGLQKADGVARGQTLLSLGLWVTVIICGRWIAYV